MLKSKFSSLWGIFSVILSLGIDMKKVQPENQSSWRNRLARSTVNREVVGSIPTEDALFLIQRTQAFKYSYLTLLPYGSKLHKLLETSSNHVVE